LIRIYLGHQREFSPDELDFMRTVAEQCAGIIERVQCMENQQEHFNLLATQMDKMSSLGRMAAGIAHEINNPLAGILLYSSHMRKKVLPGSGLDEGLDVIIKETKRCKTIIQGLLDFARNTKPQRVSTNVKGRVENGVGYVKKNLLAGLDLPDFTALAPAARHWLDAVANVRIHGETREKPTVLFEKERPCLNRLPLKRYDVATVYPVRATNQFRVAIDTNRYSVPAEYASRALIAKLSPEWICIYHDDRLIARHGRCYDRHRDIEDPDHPKQLLLWRKKAREQTIVMRFLSLSPRAAGYYRKLEQRRMNPYHHVQKIVALSEIYGTEAVARALEDAFVFAAFSCEYIANLLEQRSRKLPQPGALHLTRRQDLLELEVESADLSLYEDNAHER